MTLNEVAKKMAIHVSGRFFLDRPDADRRYAVIRVLDPMDTTGDADDYTARRFSDKPEDFPDDGWIPLT